jgi:hypothetical protein
VVVVRIAIIVLLVTSASVADADGNFGVHLGGGMEGGLITGKPRPDVLGELGLAADWIPAGHDVGVGAAFDRVARPLDIESEHTVDLLVRVRGKHDSVIGFGMGVRWLDPGGGQPSWFGYDWFRLDATMPATRNKHASVDFYVRWTIGCYVSHGGEMAERPQLVRDIHCGDTLTTSYVVGIQASLH